MASDYSPGMVEVALKLAAANGVQIQGRTMNAIALDCPDNTFDFVYASNLLHHLPDPRAAILKCIVFSNLVEKLVFGTLEAQSSY